MAFNAYGSETYGTGFYKGQGVGALAGSNDRLFRFLPDWNSGIMVSYFLSTVITKARFLQEQRKPLLPVCKRMQEFSAWDNVIDKKIEIFLKLNQARYVYMPIFSEPIKSVGSGSMTGDVSITTQRSFASYYNLKNLTEFIILIDLLDESGSLLFPVAGFTGENQINLDIPISDGFLKEQTVIFPCMYASIENVQFGDETDELTQFKLTYKEWF